MDSEKVGFLFSWNSDLPLIPPLDAPLPIEIEDIHLDQYCYKRNIPICRKQFTLQTKIIDYVINNLDFFIGEYLSSSSQIPKHHFQCLQKVYSHQILQRLLKDENLKHEYLDFVINSYTREIDLHPLSDDCRDVQYIEKKIIQVACNLSKFSVMGGYNFLRLRSVLPHLKAVKELELEYAGCKDEDLKVIAENCPLLKSLNVYVSRVTDVGMKHLCCNEGHKLLLESLNISRTFVNYSGVLNILENMPTIEEIIHEEVPKIICAAVRKNRFPRGKVLSLTNLNINSAKSELKICAEVCPNIKYLSIKYVESEKDLAPCSIFKNLERVFLAHHTYSGPMVSLDPFFKICGLRITTLNLDCFSLSVPVLLHCCPNLKNLELFDPNFEHFCEKNISQLKFEHLNFFKICGCSLMEGIDSSAFIINSSPNLQFLTVQSCEIGVDMEKIILNCPAALNTIDLTNSDLSDSEYFTQEILLRHTSLCKFVIANCKVPHSEYLSLCDLATALTNPITIVWSSPDPYM